MKYVFDTNILIDLQRRQPIDVYPSVWNAISDLMQHEIVISSQEVLEEIIISDDALCDWTKRHRQYFLTTSVEVQSRAREILKKYRGLVEGGKKKNSADPFVIALAQECRCKVVSEETRTNNEQSPKIPDVCDKLHIECIGFVGFSREMRLLF